MIRIGDTFASLAPGHNYRTGLQYERGALFTIRGINEREGLCMVRHIDSGRDFKETQSRLESDFIKMPKTVYYTSDYAYINGHLDQVDEATLGVIKSLVEESITQDKPETTIADLEDKLDMQAEVMKEMVAVMKEQQKTFDNQIKIMKYRAYQQGIRL